ncbi:nucleotidyltransferase domain-containing protein [Halocatena marina]|uniref:nucleotidyltransferase domain-containing protein n=1 Tax=Halocatena marina TaxID=2934937 RepID=UPI002010BA22|nr:nucleotidyltransferase domain-containing protein [Halocatena marina]
MSDPAPTLRRHLDRYLDTIDPATLPDIVGVCLTGSLATEFADEYSDIDLMVVVDNDGTDANLADIGKELIPDEATAVQWRESVRRYSFDWKAHHFDVDVVRYEDLRGSDWDLETRWEYDNAEVLVDPTGRVTARLCHEVPFSDGELAKLIEQYADTMLFDAQWKVQKACLRGSFHAAHRAATQATDAALTLLYLREHEFVPYDKWVITGLETLAQTDKETRTLVWDATCIRERTPDDVHRRVQALQSLWKRIAISLREMDCIDVESLSWEAPPVDLCFVD